MIDTVWLLLIICSVVFGAANGRLGDVSAAALDGAKTAVELAFSLAGTLCLWNGVLEVMRRAGLDRALARAARPLLGRLLPDIRSDDEALGAVSANLSANLLGLGNAATPLGIRAASLMARGERATDSLCTFVVMNTASLQLVPATIAALRASLGAKSPFDILPAVWCSSAVALAAGLAADRLFRRIGRRRGKKDDDGSVPSPRRYERSAAEAGMSKRGGDPGTPGSNTSGGGAARPTGHEAESSGAAHGKHAAASRRGGAAARPDTTRDRRGAQSARNASETLARGTGETSP